MATWPFSGLSSMGGGGGGGGRRGGGWELGFRQLEVVGICRKTVLPSE